MLVIHGIWAYGALHAWAEDPALPEQAPPRQGRPSRAPRPHPFAVQAAVLADLLAELASPLPDVVRKAVDDELTLRLPTAADGPLASPELTRPEPSGLELSRPEQRSQGRPALAAWRVPVLIVEPAAAAAVLTALDGPGQPHPELTAGGSVRYLAAAARFAADLAGRGRVLPALVAEEDGYAARWRPVLAAADAQRARELAVAMPPLCRAADDAPAGAALADMLDALADSAARARLQAPLLPARRGRRPARIDLSERTVAALTTPDARVEVAGPDDVAEAESLAAALGGWLASARLPAGPVRTCFRLVEPPAPDSADPPAPDLPAPALAAPPAPDSADPYAAHPHVPSAGTSADDRWRVEFALQSADDPSLMLPAADVWTGAGFGWLAGDAHPDELLLAGLGAAARLFPELDAALREAAPAAVTLGTAGALQFLRDTGPLLAGAGFGVLLPDWARKARLGLKLTTRSSSAAGSPSARQSALGLQDLVEFRYDLAVGDQVLSAEELDELATMKVPLVRIRGQWVELDDQHLTAALKFLERKGSGTMTAAEALRVGVHGAAEDVPLTAVDADGWLGDLLSGQADRRLAPMATPGGFRGELRPYQQRGLAWLSFLGELGLGAVLADDMGLGKTVQLLALVASRAKPAPDECDIQPVIAGSMSHSSASRSELAGPAGGLAGPAGGLTLLVCPMSLVGNWQREAARFAPDLRVHVHHGAERLAGDDLAAALAGAELVITTYGIATRDRTALGQVTWTRVACDETQTPDTRTATPQVREVQSTSVSGSRRVVGRRVDSRQNSSLSRPKTGQNRRCRAGALLASSTRGVD